MLNQPKLVAWTIVDADTIEELAKKLSIDPKVLKDTVDTYNKAVDTKKDPFGRAETMLVDKIIKAPFYVGIVTMKRHHTMGGVINTKTEVIDRDGKVIPGLWAAGEITGVVHGTSRVGGNAMADIFSYGCIAGETAAKANKTK